jgi:hypothetical protein
VTDQLSMPSDFDELDRATVQALSPRALLEQVGLRRAEGTHRHCDAAIQMLEWYGRTRGPADVAALLALLPADPAGRADRSIVAQGAAQGRPPAEAAQVAGFLAADAAQPAGLEDCRRMCALVAAFRSAREIAEFVCILESVHQGALAEAVVGQVAEHRTMETVARLELTLRAHHRSELASRMVTRALGRRGPAEEIAELIDFQLAYGPRMTGEDAVGEPVATHIREQMPEAKLVELVLREYRRDPGRALAWCAGVAESAHRPISTVVELLAKVSANQHADLAEKITATVATRRGAEELIAYITGCIAQGHDVFDALFRRVGAEADPDIVSNLLQLWNAQYSAKNTRLRDVLALCAPAATLLGAAAHLAARSWQSLADDLLRAALEQPQRFEAVEVGRLLASMSRAGVVSRTTRRGDVVHSVLRKLDSLLSTEADARLGLDYLAALTCTIDDSMTASYAANVRTQIFSMVYNRAEPGISERYSDALRVFGRNDLAEEYLRATRVILLPNAARRRA